jgi:hypothetical protein
MKFKDLTEADKNYALSIYKDKEKTWDERMTALMKFFGKGERTCRRWCSERLGFSEKADVIPEQLQIAKTKQHDTTKKRFLITAAQNATDINIKFWNNLLAYSKHIDAEILVIPYRYHNPTSIVLDSDKKQEWWNSKIVPYLTLNRHNLNSKLTILSDVKIQPTAIMPLTNLECLCRESCVVGHPRIHMKSLPVLDDKPRIMFTTGNLTKPNFTDSKIGKISEFHLTYGALVVEIKDEETFFARQITAKDNGDFNDLYWNVCDGIITRNKSVAALVKGDIHYGAHDESVINRSFNELIPKLIPNEIFLHDLADFKSVNPHEEKDWIQQYKNEVNDVNSLKKEIEKILQFLDKIKKYNLVIVFSNHDNFLDRFIINSDPKKNIKNALEFIDYAKILMENKAPNGLLGYIVNEKFPNIKVLPRDGSYKVKGWELSKHGMDGTGGSRGNVQQFKRLNTKMVTAHGHGVARFDGAVQVGCNCKLRQGYNHSASDWVHSDVIIHNDGKCQTILYIGDNSEYTTFE